MNIFVAKLSSSTTSENLQELFEEHGEVITAKVIHDKLTGYSKRFGFVEMKNENEALTAIQELNNHEFNNSKIVVTKARPKEDSSRQKENKYNRY
jgi:RNA recognition motif-containing protein